MIVGLLAKEIDVLLVVAATTRPSFQTTAFFEYPESVNVNKTISLI